MHDGTSRVGNMEVNPAVGERCRLYYLGTVQHSVINTKV